MSGVRPTTVNHGPSESLAYLNRRPIGSASGHKRFAIVWLMTATGVLSRASAAVNVRPLTSVTPNVEKKCSLMPA